MKQHVIKHHSNEWHAFRKGGIGGSEIASVLGIDPYRCSLELFHQKIGLAPKTETNQRMIWGTRLEDEVAQAWKYWAGYEAWQNNVQTGNKVRKCRKLTGYVTNKKCPWLFFSPDRIINKNQFGWNEEGEQIEINGGYLECKTIDTWAYHQLDHVIPAHYTAQVQMGMMMLGFEYGELAILIGGNNFKVLPLYPNPTWQAEIIEKSRDFWRKVELARERLELLEQTNDLSINQKRKAVEEFEPEMSDTEEKAYCNYVGIAYQEEGNGMAPGQTWHASEASEYQFVKANVKLYQAKADKLKADLIREIQHLEVDGLDFGKAGKVTYKANKNGIFTFRNTYKHTHNE